MKIIHNKQISSLLGILAIILIIFLLPFIVEAGGGGGKKPSTPPPPPPPCPIQSAGCYKTGDAKAGFGELTTPEFGYFLPENKCKSSSGCDCRGIPADVPEETNPDDSSGACNCIVGTDWNAKARCCGDDAEDCGKISSGVLCSIDANAESASWIASTPSLGEIRFVGCAGTEYVSDGSAWIKCDGTFWRKTIGNSEYICAGKGRESIFECCGDGSCKSRLDGRRLSTGQSTSQDKLESNAAQSTNPNTLPGRITGNAIAAGDGKTYYCRPDRKFATDLDVPNSQAKDKTLIGKNSATCEKAGFAWTGTKCCSEDDDANEYYNDPNGEGGCFDKKPVISVSFVEGTADSVVNFNGVFHGCAIEKQNFNKDNDNLLSLADKHTGAALITNHEYCFNDPEKNFFCSYTEKWIQTDGADKSHVSFAPVANTTHAADCCAAGECWNGEECIENQKNDPLARPTGANSRCIDGEWTESELRVTVDEGASGYCPKKTQCLANVFGAEEGQCFETGAYFDDNLCESGIWSTRTKLLALKLLDMKSGDFTLFCDDKVNALNNLQYITSSNTAASSILSSIKSNNFCVLKTGSRIIAGTSINKNLSEISSENLNIFGVASCSDALANDGLYHPCDSTGKVWFNNNLKIFIYSSSPITVPQGAGRFEEFMGGPVKSIIDTIKRLISSPPFDESYLKGVKKFDKLYISQQDGKLIKGAVEGTKFKNAVIEYTNFEADICKFAGQFSQSKEDVSSGISCQKEGNNYYVLAQGSQFTTINPESIWADLTSKLRIK